MSTGIVPGFDGTRTAEAADRRLADWRREIDAALARWAPAPPACPPVLAGAIRYAIGTGGKRVRPLLCLAAADAVARARRHEPDAPAHAVRQALPAACAVEFVHTQSLVHDDLPAMDNDVLRRGQPTVHVRYGEGLAILVGDGLLAEAFGLLAREPQATDPRAAARTLRVISALGDAAGAAGMAAGQALDLAGDGGPCDPADPAALARVTEVHARKTGGLIRAAAVTGALMADGTDADVDAIGAFATDLGLAFQIVDDVLDVAGPVDTLGKTPRKDERAGKPTFASLLGPEAARRRAQDLIEGAVARLEAAGLSTPELAVIAEAVLRRCPKVSG